MKSPLQSKSLYPFAWVLLLAPLSMSAQCELLKSETKGVNNYMTTMSQRVDSLRAFAESAAFGAQFNKAHANAIKVEQLIGEALTAADEAVSMASEAQYHSEVCGIADVKSNAIDAEQFAIDARDLADEAYTNAKLAHGAKNLGNLRYYMRKSQNASKEAQKWADAAAFSASLASHSCTHTDASGIGSE